MSASATTPPTSAPRRLAIRVTGCVQGVGFRPTVYRHAVVLGLHGFVQNGPAGVEIEVEGPPARVDAFLRQLRDQPPPQARIDTFDVHEIAVTGHAAGAGFAICASRRSGDVAAGMPPDIATCADCRRELLTPGDRRYRYPFINCTNCGPRFTLIDSLPYDRERTSMATFRMCPDCDREYHEPADRRFDAQPDACAVCGPRLTLRRPDGSAVPGDPLVATVQKLLAGAIVAVKGVGGFHLCCLATDEAVLARLRERKRRPHKSLAVMGRDIATLRGQCESTPEAEALLASSAAPIVVLRRRADATLSRLISPDTDDIGVFLPYTPVHLLLLDELSRQGASLAALVMTSANLAEEPIAADWADLGRLLGTVVDLVLDHDRRILRRCDDSVIKPTAAGALFLRRSRGYVPAPLSLAPGTWPGSVLACGAELKNVFCVTRGTQAFLSQHIGDVTDYPAFAFFRQACADLVKLLGVTPERIAFDLHPDYLTSRFARESAIPVKVPVQHHHAHIASVLAEHGETGPVLGVAFDGTGYGTDGTVWGGEFLVADRQQFRRVACLKPFPLPGGDAAIHAPVRLAFSLLLSSFGEAGEALAVTHLPGLTPGDRRVLANMIVRRVNSPLCSSAGRLFDAVAVLLGCCDTVTYEGQAAIRLQALAGRGLAAARSYPVPRLVPAPVPDGAAPLLHLDCRPLVEALVADLTAGCERAGMAAGFHAALATAIADSCRQLRDTCGAPGTAALSGGVFQNDLLLELALARLQAAGFRVLTHRLVAPNDSCIALGQAAVAAAMA